MSGLKAGENILVWDTMFLGYRMIRWRCPRAVGHTGLLLRDEVETGDIEVGFIITEVGFEVRGVVEISQGKLWGMKEKRAEDQPSTFRG